MKVGVYVGDVCGNLDVRMPPLDIEPVGSSNPQLESKGHQCVDVVIVVGGLWSLTGDAERLNSVSDKGGGEGGTEVIWRDEKVWICYEKVLSVGGE